MPSRAISKSSSVQNRHNRRHFLRRAAVASSAAMLGAPEADKFIKREYRKGWELPV
jgi:hypothetical protein